MFNKAIIAATLATAVSASIPNLQGRQDLAGLGPECQSAIASVLPLYGALPTPPPALLSNLPTDPCATPTLTGAVSSEYAAYTGSVYSWYASNSQVLLSALGACTQLASYAASVPICTAVPTGGAPVPAPSGSGSVAAPYPTATGAPSGAPAPIGTGGAGASMTKSSGASSTKPAGSSSTSNPIPTGAAVAQQGGVVAAAVAAGAVVLGALAL